VEEEKRLTEYRRDFHKMLLPGVDGTTIGIADAMCEKEVMRKQRELKKEEHYCGLCDEPVKSEDWDKHRLTPSHSAIEFDVQMIYALWRHIGEVKRRRYDEKGNPDSLVV
jgi:hypothetical protein